MGEEVSLSEEPGKLFLWPRLVGRRDVVDRYGLPMEYFRDLRASRRNGLVAMDDWGYAPSGAHLVVNQNLGLPQNAMRIFPEIRRLGGSPLCVIAPDSATISRGDPRRDVATCCLPWAERCRQSYAENFDGIGTDFGKTASARSSWSRLYASYDVERFAEGRR